MGAQQGGAGNVWVFCPKMEKISKYQSGFGTQEPTSLTPLLNAQNRNKCKRVNKILQVHKPCKKVNIKFNYVLKVILVGN